jgi:hypothetical protein
MATRTASNPTPRPDTLLATLFVENPAEKSSRASAPLVARGRETAGRRMLSHRLLINAATVVLDDDVNTVAREHRADTDGADAWLA